MHGTTYTLSLQLTTDQMPVQRTTYTLSLQLTTDQMPVQEIDRGAAGAIMFATGRIGGDSLE